MFTVSVNASFPCVGDEIVVDLSRDNELVVWGAVVWGDVEGCGDEGFDVVMKNGVNDTDVGLVAAIVVPGIAFSGIVSK